jgi:hypothetical protein
MARWLANDRNRLLRLGDRPIDHRLRLNISGSQALVSDYVATPVATVRNTLSHGWDRARK